MAVLAVTHEVEDYDNWRKVYDDNDDIREKYGIERSAYFRTSTIPT